MNIEEHYKMYNLITDMINISANLPPSYIYSHSEFQKLEYLLNSSEFTPCQLSKILLVLYEYCMNMVGRTIYAL